MMHNDDFMLPIVEKIAPCIEEFFQFRANSNACQFNLNELIAFVQSRHPILTSDSPSRIMRHLRGMGKIDYVVVNRAKSLYEIKRKV